MKTHTGFLFRHSPAAGQAAKEGLDALLATAAFEQPLYAIFTGDGVYQLLDSAEPAQLGLPALNKQLAALPLYGVDTCYVHRESAQARGLALENPQLHWLDDQALAELLGQCRQVVSF